MKASQYAKIAEHPLRFVFRNMVTDHRDLPSRSQLRAAIMEAVPQGTDSATVDKLFQAAEALAKKAASEGRESWFDLRGESDRYVLGVIESWEAADRLLSDEDTDAVDVSDTLAAIDNWNPTERTMRAHERSLKADELAANVARQRAGN